MPQDPDSTPAATAPSGFHVSRGEGAVFDRGLRAFFAYRDLGIREATQGRVVAHVIRAVPGEALAGAPHRHLTTFQMVYVLRGWVRFDYAGQGEVLLQAGDCVHQPPGIHHRELAHSDDLELLEIVMPGDFATETVASLSG